MNDKKVFCRRCNEDLLGEDSMRVGEYSFCMSCMIEREKDKLNKAIEALEFYGCEKYYEVCPLSAAMEGSKISCDFGKIARETLDEIKNGPSNLRGKKEERQEEEQVGKK